MLTAFLALFWPKIASGRYVFWGMLIGLAGGIALTFGGLAGVHGRPLGALFAFFAPLAAVLIAYLMRPAQLAREPL